MPSWGACGSVDFAAGSGLDEAATLGPDPCRSALIIHSRWRGKIKPPKPNSLIPGNRMCSSPGARQAARVSGSVACKTGLHPLADCAHIDPALGFCLDLAHDLAHVTKGLGPGRLDGLSDQSLDFSI